MTMGGEGTRFSQLRLRVQNLPLQTRFGPFTNYVNRFLIRGRYRSRFGQSIELMLKGYENSQERNMKKLFSTLVALAMVAGVNADLLTQWTFEGDVTTPSTGSGTASLIGGTTATFATGWDRSTNNTGGRAWNSTNYPAQGTDSGTAGILFATSTAGYEGITVNWDGRHSNTASRFVQFQYSIDGVNFSFDGLANDGIFEAVDGGDKWYAPRSVDLSGIAGVADNANFAFRVVSIFAPGKSEYLPSTVTSSYGRSGTLRYDNVSIEGVVVPEPTSLFALISGLALASLRRR